MNFKNIFLISLISLFGVTSAHSAFPDDLEDVVFIEGSTVATYVRGFEQTSELTVRDTSVNAQFGQNISLTHTQNWPRGAASEQLDCCIGNAWGFIFIDGTWFGGAWEFMPAPPRTERSLGAFVGPRHFRFAPLANFQPRNGEVYGLMLAGFTRASPSTPLSTLIRRNNIEERTDIAFYRFGEGPITAEEAFEQLGIPLPGAAVPPTVPTGAIQILLQDDTPD